MYLAVPIPPSIVNEKSANDLKTIINTYVESVFVYDDKVEINLILFFVHINGGGEPYRMKCTKSIEDYRHNKTKS